MSLNYDRSWSTISAIPYSISFHSSLMADFVLRLFCSFYNASCISSPKIKMFCWKQKLAKTEVSKISANQDRKVLLLYLILAAQASNFYHGMYIIKDQSERESTLLNCWTNCCCFLYSINNRIIIVIQYHHSSCFRYVCVHYVGVTLYTLQFWKSPWAK